MATTAKTFDQGAPVNAATRPGTDLSVRPTSTVLFDGLMVVLGFWFMTGLFLDGSAHDRNLVDSFFTPWHALLYSGFMANAIALFIVTWRNQARGYHLWMAIPAGYELSLVGAITFGIGGILDMLWHVTFGIEVSTEALLSPSHMILAIGLFLIVNGPFRAAWRRRDKLLNKNWLGWLPMLFSLAFTFLLLTFFTFPMNPFFNVFASSLRTGYSVNDSVEFGFPQMLVQAAIFMGCVLIAARRWKLPPGSVTFILTVNVLALSVISSRASTFIPAAIATGVYADAFMLLLKPSIKHPMLFRIYAFSIPAVLYTLYFVTLQANGGVSWTLPFWSGTVVITGLVGLFLSYLMMPAPGLAVTPPEQTA